MTPLAIEIEQVLSCVMYISTALEPLDDAGLLRILESSWRHNQVAAVTGLLVYKDSNFLQVLEGPPNAIKETMSRITNDSRHTKILVLLEQTVTERLFSLWSMAFPDVDELTEEGLRRYSSYLLSTKSPNAPVRQKVFEILSNFRSMFDLRER